MATSKKRSARVLTHGIEVKMSEKVALCLLSVMIIIVLLLLGEESLIWQTFTALALLIRQN